MSSEEITLAAGDAEVVLAPGNGGRVAGLRVGGVELLRQGERFGCFPMVPWCGRIRDGRFRDGGSVQQMPLNAPPHAIHGTTREGAWRVASHGDTEAVLTYDLVEPWPYPGRVTQVATLSPDALTLTMSVEAYDSSFPAQIGWHPWFNRNLAAWRRGRTDRLHARVAGGARRGPPPHRQAPRPRARPLGRLLRHARRRRRHPHLAGAAGTEGRLPRAMGRDLRRTGGGRVCRTPDRAAQRPQHPPRLVTPIDPLEATTTWTWRRL